MTWFVLEGGQPTGPLSEADLAEAVRSGRAGPETLVWRDGMAGWEALRSVPGAGVPLATCSACRRGVPLEETVPHAGLTICAACKPAFLMRLELGLPLAQGLVFARFGTRVSARLIDSVGLFVVSTALQLPLVGFPILAPVTPDVPGFWLRQAAAILVGFGLNAAYSIGLHGRSGQTLGKRIMGIRVVRADGSRLTYGRATGRFFGDMVSSLTVLVGYLMAAFDEERRALHDRLCDTRVVEVP